MNAPVIFHRRERSPSFDCRGDKRNRLTRTWGATPREAFTLIEVVLALGLFSFAIMGIIGLLPIGLETNLNAKILTVRAQIQQRLTGEVVLTDYSALPSLSGSSRYFSEEGIELSGSNAGSSIYTAETVVSPVKLPTANGYYASNSASDVTFYVIADPAHRGITSATGATGSVIVAQITPTN